MLTIVQQEHQPLRPECIGYTLRGRRADGQLQSQGGSDRDKDEVGLGERPQLGDPDPVGKFRQQEPRNLEAQCRLADAPDTGQRDQPMLGQASRPMSSDKRPGRLVGESDAAGTPGGTARTNRTAESAERVRISPVN